MGEVVNLAALKRLLDHPDQLKKMGKAARERCFKLFDSNNFNKKVAEEYLSILKIKKCFVGDRALIKKSGVAYAYGQN